MNLSEFKAWFEGFTEDMSVPPNKKQWARVQEKIAKIKDAPPVEKHIFHDRYYRPWRPYYDGPYWSSTFAAGGVGQSFSASSSQSDNTSRAQVMLAAAQDAMTEVFDSGAAFRELGKAEARSITD